ncbi:Rpn family recombination-promoting nuclease/putative transposase [Kovacikia minuta CCNUW1]|uniref:Rpn family recombination-promoting nuclease/putative transposase n=1 Tax=Kovacikia minuta TaxID=2931930 RepID=UPI001CCB97B7|nr:Rpn family recombination-promoting nuclease/putative transposase [Kovacikia minuta]UBF24260.1 Rpn family recombination-promoting nuclease/putative transposase [Kovacikia minuta CCNUW1]
MKTDSLFYRIFQTSPNAFFDLIGTPNPRGAIYRFTSEEVKQTSFRIDGILTPPPNTPDQPLYFIEVMGYRDRKGDLYPGFFSEIFLYLNRYRPQNDWRAVLIFTQRRLDPGLPIHYTDFDNGTRFQRIYLDELPEQLGVSKASLIETCSLELGILYLVGAEKDVAAEQARRLIARANQESADAASQQKILELISTVLVYKYPELSRQEIETMLGLNELKQTRVYQEALEEGREEGRQREATLVLRLLNRQVGNVEPELQPRIQQLSTDQLEELGEALLDFSTLADLITWLQAHE